MQKLALEKKLAELKAMSRACANLIRSDRCSVRPFHDARVRHAAGETGGVICWENYLPLLRAAMYAKGVEIYCAPAADARDSWIASMRHIAVEGRCFVLSCNQFNRRRDFPPDYRSSFGVDPEAIVFRGGSCIVDPAIFLPGRTWRARPYFRLRLTSRQIVRGKFDLDVVGHYARPDIFQLHVDEAAKRPVSMCGADATGAKKPAAEVDFRRPRSKESVSKPAARSSKRMGRPRSRKAEAKNL